MSVPPLSQIQFQAWREGRTPPPVAVSEGSWAVPVAMPGSRLRFVYTHVLEVDGGVAVLDPGWDSPESWLGLVHGLSILGFTPSRVMAIVATHRHSDHSGLVRRLHAESGAWIALHRADGPLPGPERGQAERRRENLARQMGVARRRRPGRPASEAGRPVPDLLLADGQLLPVAGRRLRVLWTPGHTAGHICVLDEDSMVLYAGDHLLPTITPNVSVNSRQRPDPIGDYLGSLARTADLGVHRVACAHQYHFAGAAARSRELIAHHRAALAALQAAAAARPGRTCWQLAAVVPWSQPFMQMPRRLQRAAARESMAHLVHLERTGGIRRTDINGVAHWAPT